MVIFFIILLTIIAISTLLITCSTFKIEIKELVIINTKVEKYNIVLSLNLLGKIKWLKLRLDKVKIKELKTGTKLKLFNKILDTKILRKYKNAGKIFKKDWKHILNELNKFKIEKLHLESKIGTENAASTAIITGTVSAILGIVLARKASNPQYKIEPIYINENYIYLSINCIIAIKLVHIINMNKRLGKEVYQENGRTSNRRTYVGSNG